jgi:hypothetical protein
MPPHHSSLLSSQATRRRHKAGCLSFFLLPAAGILAIGLFIVIVAMGTTPQKYGPGATAQPGQIAKFFSPTVKFWGASIEKWAAQWNLETNLVATVMQIESCGDPDAVSQAGATGLFQVMPFHFKAGERPQDPSTNAYRGLAYLKISLDAAHGDVRLALASYNGGMNLIGQVDTLWPDETVQYTYWGSKIYQDTIQGADSSQTLNKWLLQNGWRLCLQASQRLGIRP